MSNSPSVVLSAPSPEFAGVRTTPQLASTGDGASAPVGSFWRLGALLDALSELGLTVDAIVAAALDVLRR